MNEGESLQPAIPNDQDAASVSADNLLVAEYNYIAQTAYQANEDRARVSTYYVVTFGTLVGALFSLQIGNAPLDNLHRALIVVFLTLALFGLSTLLQLVRLRQAWTESVRALNQIKEFYINQLPQVPLQKALRWGTKTIPASYKPWSIAFLLAGQVALLGGVSLGASVYFMSLVWAAPTWLLPIFCGLLYTLFQLWIYQYLLR